MKITVVENNDITREDNQLGWYLISDSAWTNAGKPFFYPENTEIVTVYLAPVIRINRLGKYIAEKFAGRYYSEFAAGLHFTLPQVYETLVSKGLSTDAAHSFDRSLIVSPFFPLPENLNDILMSLEINDQPKAHWNPTTMKFSLDKVISEVSKTNTVKMGDFIIPTLVGAYEIKIGDLLKVSFPSGFSLSVKVK